MLCYLPVGSQKAVERYAHACLETGVSLLNCMPVFIVSTKNGPPSLPNVAFLLLATTSNHNSARPSFIARS